VIFIPDITFSYLLYKIRHLLLSALCVAALCQTNFFMRTAYYSNVLETVPGGDYGPGFYLFIAYFIVMVSGMMISVRQTFLDSTGVQRTESQFLLLGWLLSFSLGLVLYTISIMLNRQETTRFLPLFALIMDGFVAYGIATRRILSVSVVLQRLTAYMLMAVYLVGLYFSTVWLVDRLFYVVIEETSSLSHLLAALVVAFSVMPAQGLMKNVSSRLFSASRSFDIDQILEETRRMFQEVSSEEKLMADFSSLVIQAFKTTRVALLRMERDGVYRPQYVFPEKASSVELESSSGLVKLLQRDHQPFTTDTLERMRPSRLVNGARQEMAASGAAVAVGSSSHSKLETVVLLFPKTTGAIFDAREQRALQILCDQMAVALENASLYTEVQDGKLYNETLIDSLASGLVAVNEDRIITVFNQRAQAITKLSEECVVNRKTDVLPDPLIAAIESILKTGAGFRDKDMMIPSGDGLVPIRISGSVFHSHTGKKTGALLVFSDMTLLRKMEEQIRRTDRLSSIGTLSAGMAHEIKNPLVTIKTFTDLLPHQHGDEEFRHTFFELVGQEVQRIDEIVNRLLNFARPAKASLKPVFLHEVLRNSLRLMEQQMAKQNIALAENLAAPRHQVMADAEQLKQTFVNLFMNAIQAMEPGGTLSVATEQLKSTIRVDVRDTGSGMSPEQKKHIFDPFFTTKETGVGLGLSVSHGIICEHKGTVDVESEQGVGTVFHIEFPLMNDKEASKG
jgi:signal transduction histidine kinase